MRKNTSVLLTIGLSTLILMLLISIVLVVNEIISDSVQVFDIANFMCTLVFSLIACAFSTVELVKLNKSEKDEYNKKEYSHKVKSELKSFVEDRMNKIINVQIPYGVCDDYPTYTDLELNELRSKFMDMYEGEQSIKIAEKQILDYLESLREIMDEVIKKGKYLSSSVVEFAFYIKNDVDKINAVYMEFLRASGVLYWTLLKINEMTELNELEKFEKLYNEGSQVCMTFDVLWKKRQSNSEWFKSFYESLLEE